VQPFPEKLIEVLERSDTASVITWLPHGRSFIVRDTKLFVAEVLPRFFRQSKFMSFTRQLNLWGFKRITKGVDSGAYYHELFLRGKAHLAKRMRRRKVKGTGAKLTPNPDEEPDFYALAKVRPLPDLPPCTKPLPPLPVSIEAATVETLAPMRLSTVLNEHGHNEHHNNDTGRRASSGSAAAAVVAVAQTVPPPTASTSTAEAAIVANATATAADQHHHHHGHHASQVYAHNNVQQSNAGCHWNTTTTTTHRLQHPQQHHHPAALYTTAYASAPTAAVSAAAARMQTRHVQQHQQQQQHMLMVAAEEAWLKEELFARYQAQKQQQEMALAAAAGQQQHQHQHQRFLNIYNPMHMQSRGVGTAGALYGHIDSMAPPPSFAGRPVEVTAAALAPVGAIEYHQQSFATATATQHTLRGNGMQMPQDALLVYNQRVAPSSSQQLQYVSSHHIPAAAREVRCVNADEAEAINVMSSMSS